MNNQLKQLIINNFGLTIESFITCYIIQNFQGNEQLQELPGKVTNINITTLLNQLELTDKQLKILSDYHKNL